MKIISRHLALDMYKCKLAPLQDLENLLPELQGILAEADIAPLSSSSSIMPDKHLAIALLFEAGHITIHAFPELKYVSADAFLCQEAAAPEKLFSSLIKLFKPETHKTTQLKRGDFGSNKDMKPKTRTRVAPLRRIHNTGSKVINLLGGKKKD